MPKNKKVQVICLGCGSTDIRRNADTVWNIENQEWEISALFDTFTCEDCGEDCSVIEIDLFS